MGFSECWGVAWGLPSVRRWGQEPGRGGETWSGLRPGGLGVPWVIHLSEVRVRRQVQETECVQGVCDTDFDSKVYVGM